MTNNSGDSVVNNSEQPDPDFIKMFVGQIPRSMDENDLRKMFEEFGRVHQINVLRDKVTGQSKGRRSKQVVETSHSDYASWRRRRFLRKEIIPLPRLALDNA